MATKNFYISANIDGRKTQLTGGPQSKDGGFRLSIYIRSRGNIKRAFNIDGYARADGTLHLEAQNMLDDPEANNTLIVETER